MTPTEWVLHRLIARKETYSQVYPMLYKIAQLCTMMPVSNAYPERGVSTLWRVKTCVRSHMENDLLEALMHVFINGPAVSSKEGSKIIDRAVKQWSQVRRRKLPNVLCATCMNVSSKTSTSDAQVQTGEQDDVAHSSDDEAKGPEAEELSETARTLFSLIFSDLVDISSRQRLIIDNVRE
ncbi:unnamed protein product [Porites lobata]|uniref:HAT C-terminal dimerisation domain-containing protein n=1 Tax=Porites lobata TaxID=104759 RepID=A0ABN8PAD7_9CNID|nr:unnamed protein product [Porites lobata]